MFTAGRYEYRNKGVDMFIEALARLNHRLQKSGSTVTVVAFIIMPAATHSYTIEAMKGQAVTKQLREAVTEIQQRIGERLFDHAARVHGYASKFIYYIQLTKYVPTETSLIPSQRLFSLQKTSSSSNVAYSP